jgi:hypothetical protein
MPIFGHTARQLFTINKALAPPREFALHSPALTRGGDGYSVIRNICLIWSNL